MPPKEGDYVGKRLRIAGQVEWPGSSEPEWVAAKVTNFTPETKSHRAAYRIYCEDGTCIKGTAEFVEKYLADLGKDDPFSDSEAEKSDELPTGTDEESSAESAQSKEYDAGSQDVLIDEEATAGAAADMDESPAEASEPEAVPSPKGKGRLRRKVAKPPVTEEEELFGRTSSSGSSSDEAQEGIPPSHSFRSALLQARIDFRCHRSAS